MPKVTRERVKQHSAAVSIGRGPKSKSRPAAAEIAVEEADLEGLDVDAAAGESEESKRAAMAEALKDLIGMDDDDDDDEDDEDIDLGDDDDDEEDEEDAMADGKMPARGTLFKAPAKQAASAAPAASASTSKLVFAPSAPSRSAVSFAAAPAVAPVAASADDAAPAPFRKTSKIDKRAARHQKLMSRLGLPGTEFGTRGQKKHGNAGAFQSLRDEMSAALLSPTEQNARTMAARREAAQAEKRDVLFLNDGADQERMRRLQASIASSKAQQKAAAQAAASAPAQPQGAQNVTPAANAAAAPSSSPFESRKPMSAAARRALQRRELAQFSAVLTHPQFQAAPLQSLQLHLQNTAQMNRLQAEAHMMEQQSLAAASQPKQQRNGSQKKQQQQAEQRRQEILQQLNQ